MQIAIVSVKCRVQLEPHQAALLRRPTFVAALLAAAGAETELEENDRGGYLYFTAQSEAHSQTVLAELTKLFTAEPESTEDATEATVAEVEPWQVGVDAVRERLPNALVFYSFNELPDKLAVAGKVVFTDKHDGFFGDGGDFRSEVVENPTYLDVALIADQAIRTTGDRHHSFIEGFDHLRDEGDVKVCRLLFGS